jgi:hypothetical protein
MLPHLCTLYASGTRRGRDRPVPRRLCLRWQPAAIAYEQCTCCLISVGCTPRRTQYVGATAFPYATVSADPAHGGDDQLQSL